MALPVLMPIGIVESNTNNTDLTFLTLPVDHNRLTLDTPVLIKNTYNNAVAVALGVVTELTNTVGAIKLTKSEISPNWPENVEPFGYANPIYIAKDNETYEPKIDFDMFVPDHTRLELLSQLSEEHLRVAQIHPDFDAYILQQQPDNDLDNVTIVQH